MLDLNHPMSDHIFRASGLIDGVMKAAQAMTVAPSVVRRELLARCLPRFDEMRELNRQQFGDSSFINTAIDEYEASIRKLAGLGDGTIVEDRRDGEGDCPFCRTPITKFNPFFNMRGHEGEFIIYCLRCCEICMPAMEKLRSFEGFRTEAI